jgi:hypothetical protein
MPRADLSRRILAVASDIGKLAAAEREAATRLLIGSIADAVREHHDDRAVQQTMTHMQRQAGAVMDRVRRQM